MKATSLLEAWRIAKARNLPFTAVQKKQQSQFVVKRPAPQSPPK